MTERFYVSVINGPKRALLRGPFLSHGEALDRVEETRAIAEKLDPWAVFYAFGTVGIKGEGPIKKGVLNDRFTYP